MVGTVNTRRASAVGRKKQRNKEMKKKEKAKVRE